jgi:leucyl/phenylalanyl-tRNA---protein transferase
MSRLCWLGECSAPDWFPADHSALSEPDGLIAAGGDLSPRRLVAAYTRGIFPWYSAGQPILWWTPDPRMVLFPDELRVSRSLAKSVRNRGYEVAVDRDFSLTIQACARPRRHSEDTWLTDEMIIAYQNLHSLGYAHSVETYLGDQLVGGLYGLALGGVFFGESMWSAKRDASKVALVYLVDRCKRQGIHLIDCQVASAHLASLGARQVTRSVFTTLLARWVQPEAAGRWTERDVNSK